MEAEFDKNKLHIRNCMFYEYFQGKNATQASQKIYSIYGEDILSVRVSQNWFRRFRDNNYCLEDEEKSGRPSEISSDELQEILTEDSRLSTRQIAEKLEVDHTTVLRKLHDMGKVATQWQEISQPQMQLASQVSNYFLLLIIYQALKGTSQMLMSLYSWKQNQYI